MGQYYLVCNLDKKQFLHPHKFGDGLKLMEFGLSAKGTMSALAVLLADGNNCGGGDLHSDHPIIGSWAGDRIVVAGDYADEGKWGCKGTLYSETDNWEDISYKVLFILLGDSYFRDNIRANMKTMWNEERKGIISEFLDIHDQKSEDLPLLIGHIKTPEAKAVLEERIKELCLNTTPKESSRKTRKRTTRSTSRSKVTAAQH